MSELKIEKSIAIPPPRVHFPFGDMKAGESVFIAFAKNERRLYNSAIQSAYQYAARRDGMRFTTRVRQEKGVTGVRIWRVS